MSYVHIHDGDSLDQKTGIAMKVVKSRPSESVDRS